MKWIHLQWLGVCLVSVLALGCDSSSSAPPPVDENLRVPPPYWGPVRNVLVRGQEFPALTCKGWVNGEPKPMAKDGPKLHVIDVWATWCPHCKAFGPTLAQLHDKYRPRGVQFVSVTDMPKSWVEKFGKDNAVTWPSGYALSADVLGEIGAVNTSAMAQTPGYNVAPTIFVVAADGRVVGTDEQGRWHHHGAAEIVKRVEELIEKGLAEADGPKKP